MNGYKIIYLSARGIGYSTKTKSYIDNLTQESQSSPDGPVILNPASLLDSFKVEVILKQSERFKAKVLKDIKGLFPNDQAPFYAGFGNRDKDAIAYRSAGVQKTFIINPSSILHSGNVEFNGYSSISEIVDYVFPSLKEQESQVHEAFKNFTFWKTPLEGNAFEEDLL